MGSRDPNKVGPTVSFVYALTLHDMKATGCQLRAFCPSCRGTLRLSYDALIKLNGEHAILWGRRTPCRLGDCTGKMEFQARGLPGQTWRPMREKPGQDYLRIIGKRLYDGDAEII